MATENNDNRKTPRTKTPMQSFFGKLSPKARRRLYKAFCVIFGILDILKTCMIWAIVILGVMIAFNLTGENLGELIDILMGTLSPEDIFRDLFFIGIGAVCALSIKEAIKKARREDNEEQE